MTIQPVFSSETDEELEIFRRSVQRFLDEHASPAHLDKWREEKVVPRDLWLKAGEMGLLGISLPEEYGGMGDLRHELIIVEETGYRGLEGWAVALHNLIVAPYVAHCGTEDQKKKWLPGIVSGEIILAVGMTEPGAGSDLQGMRTSARLEGNEYVINGQKTFISNGQCADLLILACKTDPKAGSRGISLIAVETNKVKGFNRGRNLDKIGREAQDTSELFFEDMRVPAENLLGGVEGRGFAQLMTLLPQERWAIAAMGLATIERALSVTVDYTRERKMFGKTLYDMQNTQFKLAEIKTKAHLARVFVEDCMKRLMEGKLDATTASMAKLWVTETEVQVVTECLQLHGGYGYMNEYPIARMFRDSRIQTIHGGASEVMKLLIARSL